MWQATRRFSSSRSLSSRNLRAALKETAGAIPRDAVDPRSDSPGQRRRPGSQDDAGDGDAAALKVAAVDARPGVGGPDDALDDGRGGAFITSL